MKVILSILFHCVAVAAMCLQPRQFDIGTILTGFTSLVPGLDGTIRDSQPQLRANAKRQIVRYGPFVLPRASNSSGAMSNHGDRKSSPGQNFGGSSLADLIGAATGSTTMDPNGYTLLKRLKTGFCKDCTV